MIRLNRREKLYLRIAALLIGLWIALWGWDTYHAAKSELEGDVEEKRTQITSFLKSLEGESAEKYRDQSAELDQGLNQVHGRILELPAESDANLFFIETISEQAERAGLTVNSISNRRSRVVTSDDRDDDEEAADVMRELRVYFAYDAELESLLRFFELMENQEYFVAIETLTISARRRPKRRTNRNIRRRIERKPLNGNAILTTIFKPNPEATVDRYRKALPPGEEDATEEMESGGDASEGAATGETLLDRLRQRYPNVEINSEAAAAALEDDEQDDADDYVDEDDVEEAATPNSFSDIPIPGKNGAPRTGMPGNAAKMPTLEPKPPPLTHNNRPGRTSNGAGGPKRDAPKKRF